MVASGATSACRAMLPTLALDIARCLFELGFRADDNRLDASDLGLDRAAVEHEQDVALIDARAVLEFHRDNLAVEARLDSDAGDGRHRTQRLEPDRDRCLGRGGDGDGHGTLAATGGLS